MHRVLKQLTYKDLRSSGEAGGQAAGGGIRLGEAFPPSMGAFLDMVQPAAQTHPARSDTGGQKHGFASALRHDEAGDSRAVRSLQVLLTAYDQAIPATWPFADWAPRIT